MQYGNLAGRIAVELGFKSGHVSPGCDKIYALASALRERDENGECQWEMDAVTVKALKQIFEGKKAKG